MHDDTQVARVFEMGEVLKQGIFPVRWVPDLGYGYGYPIFNFYAPFAYYIGGLFNILGFDALVSTKIMMVLGIILSGVSMYLLGKEFWGKLGGVFSAILYVYAPYHAVDIYVRGDVAEFWAYSLIPLLFYSLLKLSKEFKFKYIILGSISYSLLIMSHNLTAMMITPFAFIFSLFLIFFSSKKKKLSLDYLYLFIFGFGISAFYWLPALLEMKFTNVLSQIGGGADYKDHFVCLSQLWSSPWGFGGSAPGCLDGLSFKIGKLNIIFVIFSLISIPKLLKSKRNNFYIFCLFFAFLFLTIFLTLGYSKFFWDSVSLMKFFQYPWRFLIMVMFSTSLLSGGFIWFLRSVVKNNTYYFLTALLFIILVIVLNVKNFVPQKYLNKTTYDYTNKKELNWFTSRISDEYMPLGFNKPKSINSLSEDKIKVKTGDAEIALLSLKTEKIIFIANVFSQSATIHINIAAFPSWYIYSNRKISAFVSNDGYDLILGKGKNNLQLIFTSTKVQLLSNIISLSSIFLLIIGIIFTRKRTYE